MGWYHSYRIYVGQNYYELEAKYLDVNERVINYILNQYRESGYGEGLCTDFQPFGEKPGNPPNYGYSEDITAGEGSLQVRLYCGHYKAAIKNRHNRGGCFYIDFDEKIYGGYPGCEWDNLGIIESAKILKEAGLTPDVEFVNLIKEQCMNEEEFQQIEAIIR